MAKPVPSLDVPVIAPQTGIMTQAWFDFFQAFQAAFNSFQTSTAALIASLASVYSPILRVINPQTGTSYNFAVVDSGALVTFNNASSITATIQPHSTTAIPVDAQIDIAAIGAGQLAIAAGLGVTIISEDSKLKLLKKGSAGTLVQIATDTWLLSGSLTT